MTLKQTRECECEYAERHLRRGVVGSRNNGEEQKTLTASVRRDLLWGGVCGERHYEAGDFLVVRATYKAIVATAELVVRAGVDHPIWNDGDSGLESVVRSRFEATDSRVVDIRDSVSA